VLNFAQMRKYKVVNLRFVCFMIQPIFPSKIEEQLDLSEPLPFFAKNSHVFVRLVETFSN